MPTLRFSQATAAGPLFAHNHDAVGAWPHEDGLLFAIADGVGEQPEGGVASARALEVLYREMTIAPDTWSLAKRLRRAVQEANVDLRGKSLAVPRLCGMRTTLLATAVVGDQVVAAHIGDCRLFLLRGAEVRQLSKDHTWVADQIAHGLLPPSAALDHPRRHDVSRCLGVELVVPIDLITFPLEPGDVLVQCSDGVHGVLDEWAIAGVVHGAAPPTAADALVAHALAAGSRDNLAAQVARVVDCPQTARPWWRFGL